MNPYIIRLGILAAPVGVIARYISNDQAAQIIRNQMAPSFKDKAYAQGLEQGLRELMRRGRAFAPAAGRSGAPPEFVVRPA